MASNLTPETLYGATVTGRDGNKIGKVEEVYLDNTSGQPEWVSVKTGLFGGNVSLLPLSQAEVAGDSITVPFDKSMVKDAPHHDPGRELSETDEADLYRYYGLGASAGTTGTTDAGITGTNVTGGTDTLHRNESEVRDDAADLRGDDRRGDDLRGDGLREDAVRGKGHDTSGPNTDDAMTRSKEELRVGTETREAGRARLRKHVVTHTETREVPVSREEVVVEREPITEANRGEALSGGDITEEEHEVVLTEERPVVTTETVPVERVKLGTRTVEDSETVEAKVREEQIDLDAGQETTTRGTHRD
ncbi:PRC and DUF2382 domain-containing protein [Kineococcus rhizosphaerae]|uniref:Uncharacterized protein (TIGR02271 family) n=1 Tax=Kineococcus rhizosphaerae TaxID=559628 RepID=A0A2T0QXE0_9ACTN|nr:PRC and DUF2382 domain-containing protein [Kineococcus rhizosphaerae]PRY10554.1 uncharacterized protein (TIGR02271 family) [Kineococcus rhizosphaerae]